MSNFLLRDREKICSFVSVCDRGSNQTLSSITKFCLHNKGFRCKILVEFVNGLFPNGGPFK